MTSLVGTPMDGAVAAVLAVDPASVSSAALVTSLAEIAALRARLSAVEAVVVAEVEQRRVSGDYGRATVADLLVEQQRVTPRQARAVARRVEFLTPRRTLTGEPLPELLPLTAAAFTAGTVTAEQADVIISVADRLPSTVSVDAVPVIEDFFLAAAAHEHPEQLARTGRLLLARLAEDADPEPEAERQRRRHLTLHRLPDGGARVSGYLTTEATALFSVVLDALSAPNPSQDDLPDPRNAGQRRHDAVIDLSGRLLRSDTLPASGGVPVTVLARTTLSDLVDGTGIAVTGHDDLWPTLGLLHAASDGQVIPVITDHHGSILTLGRSRRLATKSQRLALAARDGGCSFPGCDTPATWTQAHHIHPWNHGGPTNLDNLTLVCGYHHRSLDTNGWTVRISSGRAEWTPPPWIDPQQAPRINHAHHPPDITFPTPTPVPTPAPV